MPEPVDAQALRQRILHLVNLHASDEELEREAQRMGRTGSIERAICDAIGQYESGVAGEARARWMRRAAQDGQVWALWELGRRQIVDWDDDARRDEARDWLSQAASAGHRGAALLLGRLAEQIGPREIDLLIQAYGAGEPGHPDEITAGEVRAAAIEIALAYRTSDPDLAEGWYQRGLAAPGWTEPPSDWARQWTVEAAHYALWLHQRGHAERCDALLREMLPEILESTWDDRLTLREEGHKPWRYDYAMAQSADAVRFEVLAHLLEQHTWSAAERVTVLGAMADTEFAVRPDGEARLRELAERNRNAILDAADACAGGFPSASVLRGVTEADAWRAVAWVLDTALPSIFKEIGRADVAQPLRALAPEPGRLRWDRWPEPPDWDADPLTILQSWEPPDDPLQPLSTWVHGTGLRAALSGTSSSGMPADEVDDNWSVLAELLTSSGLAGTLDPETLRTMVELSWEPSFRLLRGEPAWFILWLAAGPASHAGDWPTEWARAGGIVTSALMMVLTEAGDDRGSRIAARLSGEYERFWSASRSR